MVRVGLAFEQRVAADLSLSKKLADLCLVIVAQARFHGPAWHKDGRQMAEFQGADEQPRHDLVAYAKGQDSVEHVVRECNGRRHGDHVTAEERQLHAGFALRHSIAHGRYAAGELGHSAGVPCGLLDQRREAFQGLMRRQHVVVGRNDGEVGLDGLAKHQFVIGLKRGAPVCQVGAGEVAARRHVLTPAFDASQVRHARPHTALANSRGNRLQCWMQRVHDDPPMFVRIM